MMRTFSLLLAAVLAGSAAADSKIDDFSVDHTYSGTWTSNDGNSNRVVAGTMPMASAVFVAVDGRLYISPNMLSPPTWTHKEDTYFGFSFGFVDNVFADAQCNIPLKTFVGNQSGVFNGYVWVGTAATYSPPQGWGWPAFPQVTDFETHPQHGKGRAYLIGAFTFIDGMAQGGIAPPAGPGTPPKWYNGTATYTHPGKAGDPPKRITVTNPDGTKETFTIQPGQTWTATLSGTIGGGGSGSLPTVVIEDVGPPAYNPDTGKNEPTYSNPETLPVEYDSGDINTENPDDVPTESDDTFTITTPGPPPSPPQNPDVSQPSGGVTNPNPVDPVPSDGTTNTNPNPNLDAINTSVQAGNASLAQIDENLDTLIAQGEQALETDKARSELVGHPWPIAEATERTLDRLLAFMADPVRSMNATYELFKNGVIATYKTAPGYTEVARFFGLMQSGMSYAAPHGVIPESISFSLMGKTFAVPVPYSPIRQILNIVRVLISAWAVWFYFRIVYTCMMSGLATALMTPPSSGSTRAEAAPSVAGFALGKLGGPILMLVLGSVIIMGCMASLFAILALQAEANQPFLTFLGNLEGALGDFVAAASDVSFTLGGQTINLGGSLLEIIGDMVPLGLLFSFCLLGPLYAFFFFYLPCAVLGSAIMWYAKSVT